jgi:thioredoxin-like negative regulator of GroEL
VRFQKAEAAGEYEPAVLYGLAVACEQSGDPAAAAAARTRLAAVEADRREIGELLKKLEADPQNPDLRHRAGVLCLRAGQATAGGQWLQSALAINPAHEPSRKALAEAQRAKR